MKKIVFKILFTISILLTTTGIANAVQFDVMVLPTDIFNICDNYFCFPEPSEIAANYVSQNLENYRTINVVDLSTVRDKLSNDPQLKDETQKLLTDFEQTEKIDFYTLKDLSQKFGVKSIIII